MIIIDASLFANIENDAHLGGTYGLEGHQFAKTTQYLKQYLDYRESIGKKSPQSYEKFLNDMAYLVEIQTQLGLVFSIEELNTLAQHVVVDLMKLPIGEKLTLPGGWTTNKGGHALIYELIHTDEGYQFRVINSGDGLSYHAKKSILEKELYNPIKAWSFPTPSSNKEKQEIGFFITRLLKPQLRVSLQQQAVTSLMFYEQILPTISYINGCEIEIDTIPGYCYTAGQLSGTCAQRCIHQMLKLNSSSAQNYQRFIFEFKEFAQVEYSAFFVGGTKQLTLAVKKQINLAVENNLKILNIPGLYTEEEIDVYCEKFKILQKKLDEIELKPKQFSYQPNDAIGEFSLESESKIMKKQGVVDPYKREKILLNFDLHNGEKLISNLTGIIKNIKEITTSATRYYYLEKLVLALPINMTDGLTNPFYQELIKADDFSCFETQINKIQALLLKLQKKWLECTYVPNLSNLILNIMSLQIDTQYEYSKTKHWPSFLHLSKQAISSIIYKHEYNPFWATNHPDLDRRFKTLILIKPFKTMSAQELKVQYYKDLMATEPQLNANLVRLYSDLFGNNMTPVHLEVRENGWQSVFLIASHLNGQIKLDSQFESLLEKMQNHLNFEAKLQNAIAHFDGSKDKCEPVVTITDDKIETPFNMVSLYNYYTKFLLYKYAIDKSPALDALEADVDINSPKKTANGIQLVPPKKKILGKNKFVTQQDIEARDYFHLRSVPSLQIVLTLDYFSRHLSKLVNESVQRYVEANLFEPTLLAISLQNNTFLEQFDEFLRIGHRFFSKKGRQTHASLFFVRMDYLVSRYLYLLDPTEGVKRLFNLRKNLINQISQHNDPDIIYVLQQFLFLTLMTHIGMRDKENELFGLAFSAYFYMQSHENPSILEDFTHKVHVSVAIAQFQILASLQSEVIIKKSIRTILANNPQTKKIKLEGGDFPIYRLRKHDEKLTFNVHWGRLFKNKLVEMSLPIALKNHSLIKRLKLDGVQQCLGTLDSQYLTDEENTFRIFNKPKKLRVQKKWTINGQSQLYQLKALSNKHLAYDVDQSSKVCKSSLPDVLTDGSMDFWQDTSSSKKGLLVQNNIPIYSYTGSNYFNKENQFILLDKEGQKSAYQLKALDHKFLSFLNVFESNKFIIPLVSSVDSIVKLPRYNLSFLVDNLLDPQIYLRETGEQVLAVKSPIGPAVAGLVLTNGRQKRYLVPVSRFYGTKQHARQSDFYPVVHDTQCKIADEYLRDAYKQYLQARQPQWHYENSEKTVSFRLENNEPQADTVADALYLAYLYLASNLTEKAWDMLDDCNTRLGGLTGNLAELQFISWICKYLPYCFKHSSVEHRGTPPYVACKLKALSLLSNFFLEDFQFEFNPPSEENTANALYESLQTNELKEFIKLLPQTIYMTFSELQTMRRHLEHNYTLSSTERKHLLDYYQQSQSDKKLRGALGYEWMCLSLESLLQEKEALLALNQSGSGNKACLNRLAFIDNKLRQLEPVTARSTILESVEIDLSLPYNCNLGSRDLWTIDQEIYTSNEVEKALDLLCSNIVEEDFMNYFPLYFGLANSTQNPKKLLDFCMKTLIANRHISLTNQPSISLLCNILYRVMCNPSKDYIGLHLFIVAGRLRNLTLPPLKVFQAKDIYRDILAKPEDVLKQERPLSIALFNPKLQDCLLKVQTAIKNNLNNSELNLLLSTYQHLEQQVGEEISQLAQKLTTDFEQQFVIEQAAGKVFFNLEKQQKHLAQQLLNTNDLIRFIRDVSFNSIEPLLQQKNKSWEEALDFANQKLELPSTIKAWDIEIQAKVRATLGVKDLFSIYCHADSVYSAEKTGFNPEKAQILHELIHAALFDGIQYQLAEQLRKKLDKVIKTKDLQTALEVLALLAKKKIPGLDNTATVIIQHEDDILLRDRQVQLFKKLLQSAKASEALIESVEKIPPGGGKSKVVNPVLAEHKAKGDNLVVIEVPAVSLPTNHVDLNRTSQRLFGKRAYRFEFSRESDNSAKRLEQLYQYFIEIMTTRSYLVTTGESIQSLELNYLELLLSDEKQTDEWQKQVFWLDKINGLFRHHTDCIMDEAHLGLWLRKILNYTSGEQKPIGLNLINDSVALFNYIDIDFIKKGPDLGLNYDWTDFKTKLATRLINDSATPLKEFVLNAMVRYGDDIRTVLVDYLLDKGKMSEAILNATINEKNSLAFFKQQINFVLPNTLCRKLNVNYGSSKLKNLTPTERTLAIPYGGNNTPKESSRFSEFEVINCTIQMMLLKGLSEDHFKARIKQWQSMARQELFQSVDIKDIDHTPTARGFVILEKQSGLTLSQVCVENLELMSELYQRHKYNRLLIDDLLCEQSLRQIKHDIQVIPSDTFNHVDQYRSIVAVSGTPEPTTYSQRLNFDPATSLGSDGYILEVVNEKNTVLRCFDYQHVSQYISVALSQSKSRERTRAIIDVNATFSGISNLSVAQDLAHYIHSNPSHFSVQLKQVLYFNEEQVLCALDISNPEHSILVGTSEENEVNLILGSTPDERFTYYDEKHTQGTDLKQAENANALLFVDENITFEQYVQGAMRMRLLNQGQTVELIAPLRLAGMSCQDLTKRHVRNGQQTLLTDNPLAASAQMKNVLRRLCLSCVQDLPSTQAQSKAVLARHFRTFLEDKPSFDLFELYGAINSSQKISLILATTKNQLIERWIRCHKEADIILPQIKFEKTELKLENIINTAIPLCAPEYKGAVKALSREVQLQKEVHKELHKERIGLKECYDNKLLEQSHQGWFYVHYDRVEFDRSLELNTLCSIVPQKAGAFSKTLRVSNNYAKVYEKQSYDLNMFLKPVFFVWYYFEGKALCGTILTIQDVKEIQNKISVGWIATTQDTVVAGERPNNILLQENYQSIREQVRFFNGEFELLRSQDTPLIWLKKETEAKIDFFENNLQVLRPGSETELPLLKTALNQNSVELLNHIVGHPFEDLSQFDWTALFPNIIAAQVAEYKKVGEAFIYLNKHWLEKELNMDVIQQEFTLPINSLAYVEAHLSHLHAIKKLVRRLSSRFDVSFTEQEKRCFLQCLGVSCDSFYQQAIIGDKQLLTIEERSQLRNLQVLSLIQNYPAFKDKTLKGYFDEIEKTVKANPLFRLTALQVFDKKIIANLSVNTLIELANEEELHLLINRDKTGQLPEESLLLLAEKCESQALMTALIDRSDLSGKVLLVLLSKGKLEADTLRLILLHRQVMPGVMNAVIDNCCSANFAQQIIVNPLLTRDGGLMFMDQLLARENLSPKVLETLLNAIPDYELLHRILTHPQATDDLREKWLERMKQPKNVLDNLKVKACEHAVTAINNPEYKDAAAAAITLYRVLNQEFEQSHGILSVKNKNTCEDAIEAARPTLEAHRGYKQAFVDILNVILAFICCQSSQIGQDDWRFFKVKTASIKLVDELCEPLGLQVEP